MKSARTARILSIAATSLTFAGVPGCITNRTGPGVQSLTIAQPQSAETEYWLAQPATATVTSGNFDALWEAARGVARSYFFRIDRNDPRNGVMTTEPMVSAQWHEPWRREVQTAGDSLQASLATHRRTIRYDFERLADDVWTVTPKVVIERYSQAEQRITASSQTEKLRSGSSEDYRIASDGKRVPARYWYAIGRDHALEQQLAREIEYRANRLAEKDQLPAEPATPASQPVTTPAVVVTHFEADGKIREVGPLVTIDLGSADQVFVGLTFEVFAAGALPVLGDPNPGKAWIEITAVRDRTSDVRIIKQTAGAVLKPGDVVANLVYNPTRLQHFHLAGTFDPDGDGIRIFRGLIRNWNGIIDSEITPQTDFIVLGTSPGPAEAQARAAGIPTLTQAQFFRHIGYYTPRKQ